MKFWMAALLILLAGPGVTQQHKHGHSPYAGLQGPFLERQIAELEQT